MIAFRTHYPTKERLNKGKYCFENHVCSSMYGTHWPTIEDSNLQFQLIEKRIYNQKVGGGLDK